MINRFNKILLVFFLLFFFQPSFADELEINSKTVEIDRSNQIIIAEGNVELTDSQDNLIKSKKVIYDKKKQLANTYGETEILTSEKFIINGKNIVYDNNKKVISSDEKTLITDRDGNKISVSMFNYIVDKNMFLSTGEIKIIDDRNNEYYFSEIYFFSNLFSITYVP